MTTTELSDAIWLALTVYGEARGECDDGRAAVAHVIMARTAAKFRSDGTIKSTVLWDMQFSGYWCDFVEGRYQRVETDAAGAHARGLKLYDEAWRDSLVFAACGKIASQVQARSYTGGVGVERLTDDTFFYCNTAISHPAWAEPPHVPVSVIGRHSFFRAR